MNPSAGQAPPDLQSILATLSQYVPQAAGVEQAVQNTVDVYQPAPDAQAVLERPHDPRLRPQNRSATASPKPKPMVDPATIVTWQEGLRCVTKIAAQNAQFAVSIKRMMDDQRKHEMRWYSERQALKQSQVTRVDASAKAQSILQALGTGTPAPATAQTDVEKDAELAAFDRKIFAAQVAMEEAMTGELKGLGVPFFGTKTDLIRGDASIVPMGGGLNGNALVNEVDLMALRRKMVQHLEDLYRD
ncbi:hypothetical protein LTR78_007124 [Recurvomyces mirabilis]|uniref:Uncharacterized protein n=1 Tax=Recurvomyces mirabilis TaxID=574656 RepID=A0AAE0WJS4_9PEZI|nr:hypothetical protein LTR78_007124 [Recurvomyces mirabilis]KAK5150904.1 hypothetical protein LTS14_009707 [Recurvomyces mirabilis]